MTPYATLSDDELAAERARLSQKASDLARDLAAVNRMLRELDFEKHRRSSVRPMEEVKK